MRKLYGIIVLLALALTAATPVLGSDDDGARSLFADGAGPRALALGGSYAAIADDASAAIWNPGGLGLLQHRQVQASHTNLIGLGFSEQYASFALPDWRWGVASLTLRRFGVDGIEQRDDRNLLLADDLSDSQTEILLAYGRELNPAWSFGAGLKLRRHSLAGYHDSGLGLDLGVLARPALAFGSSAPWAENLTVGAALRNAVEPALRLDVESVPDPSGLRTGAAYRHPVGRGGWILGTMDIEKTKDMDAHLHTGLEVCLVPAFALRAGLDRGTLTAGLGAEWQDVGVDYVWQNLEDEPIHRFGVSFRFGAGRDEARRRHEERAEQELGERLSDEFARRNEERKAELLRQARAAFAADRRAEAADLVAMVQVIDPQDTRARELETQLLLADAEAHESAGDHAAATVALSRLLEIDPGHIEAAAMLARVREAGDRRTARTREIRESLDRAMDLFAAGDLLGARDGFDRVLQLDPQDAEALAMSERTGRVIAGRLADLIEQADALGRAGRFADARDKLDEARTLNAAAPGLAAAGLRLDRLVAQRAARAESAVRESTPTAGTAAAVVPEPAPVREPGLSESRRRELADQYRRGLDAMAAGEADQAVLLWEMVWSADPDYQQVSENLKQHYLGRGMEAFVAGDLQQAVRHWESAVRVAPDDEKARGYLERARDQLRRLEGMTG